MGLQQLQRPRQVESDSANTTTTQYWITKGSTYSTIIFITNQTEMSQSGPQTKRALVGPLVAGCSGAPLSVSQCCIVVRLVVLLCNWGCCFITAVMDGGVQRHDANLL